MTPSQLKYHYYKHNPDGHFFDHKTMKFFGDTMKNFGCYDGGSYWILYRKTKTHKGAPPNRWKFDKLTFEERMFPYQEVKPADLTFLEAR